MRASRIWIISGIALVVLVGAVVAGLATRDDDQPEAADPEPSSASTDPDADASTTAPAGEVLTLRADGVGAHDFGAPAGEVIAALTDVLGPPSFSGTPGIVGACDATEHGPDGSLEMPPGVGTMNTYLHIIWDELDVAFAGSDPDSLVLSGWVAGSFESPVHDLHMADGPGVAEDRTAWEASYGSQVQPYDQGFRVDLPAGVVQVQVVSGPPAAQFVSAGTRCIGADV